MTFLIFVETSTGAEVDQGFLVRVGTRVKINTLIEKGNLVVYCTVRKKKE